MTHSESYGQIKNGKVCRKDPAPTGRKGRTTLPSKTSKKKFVTNEVNDLSRKRRERKLRQITGTQENVNITEMAQCVPRVSAESRMGLREDNKDPREVYHNSETTCRHIQHIRVCATDINNIRTCTLKTSNGSKRG